jgi:hypothetical protein
MTLGFRYACGAVGLLFILGCGDGGTKGPVLPEPVPVSGTVTYGDAPLADAMVTFTPTESTVGQGASGITDGSGKYVLESRWSDGKSKPGAIPGKYVVTISRMVRPDGTVWKPDPNKGPMTGGAAHEELPQEYSFKSILTADVSKDKGVHDFKLEKKQ